MSSSFSEIGSEFWIEFIPEHLLTERDGVYALSGRTAIDLVLQDILQQKRVESVAMPAWCCDSMLAPFIAHSIGVAFYEGNDLPVTDIFYLTNYFGYENTLPLEKVKTIKEQGRIVLYDRTHSFLMDDKPYQEIADYHFASIRKWMGVVGGAVIDGLTERPKLKDCLYAPDKEVAMIDKYRYLQGDKTIVKDNFLAAFGAFGHRLADDYCNYEMDNLSYTLYKQTDLKEMKRKRKENAAYIHENLKGLQFMYSLTENAAPLFVPVLFESKEQRDYVRKKLIEQQIYCPIHWPQPKQIPAEFQVNDIVSRELSIICDQRYGLNEMKRIIKVIHQNI